jgi:hypothetical protein
MVEKGKNIYPTTIKINNQKSNKEVPKKGGLQ